MVIKKIIQLIGIVFIIWSIILNLSMWWAMWDLINTIIYAFMSKGAPFPSDWSFPMPYYMTWFIENIPLTKWSYFFDMLAFVSIFVSSHLLLLGLYLVWRN